MPNQSSPILYLNTFSSEGEKVLKEARAPGCLPFDLETISNLEWNHDMVPWDNPFAFKNADSFIGGADDYLRLLTAAAPSIRLSITVTDASGEEDSPRSFSRAELKDMVRRWDFSEDEWACRDLLIAAFPEAVRRWTAEELEDIDIQDFLSEAGEKDPEAAIDMMKLLLDTVGDKLQEREVAYQFWAGTWTASLRDQFVHGPLLQRLKTDDHLARQIFQCACWDTGQKMLYEACDWFGEPELKEKLRGLAEENPYFDGFD